MLIFFLALTLGFAFELGKNALKINSRQMEGLVNYKTNKISVTSKTS
jgi:NADH-ubiquinone oxidoreductase chain 3